MENNKFQFISNKITRLKDVHSIGVIGDPGCEGLGTYNMKVYAGALKESAKDDITLIAGDLVPVGKEHYYKMIQDITETTAENPVYVLRGNHDTGEYETYFGQKNYALLTEDFALIVLDNALRKFDEEGLSLLGEVLALGKSVGLVGDLHLVGHLAVAEVELSVGLCLERGLQIRAEGIGHRALVEIVRAEVDLCERTSEHNLLADRTVHFDGVLHEEGVAVLVVAEDFVVVHVEDLAVPCHGVGLRAGSVVHRLALCPEYDVIAASGDELEVDRGCASGHCQRIVAIDGHAGDRCGRAGVVDGI